MKRSPSFTAGLVFLFVALNAFAEPSGSLSQVFKRVSNAVVVVHTAERVPSRDSIAKPVSIAGIGSGVLISADGRVVTAAHVVQTADAVAVEFPGEVMVRARVVGSDPAADVALLQLEHVPEGAAIARLGDSDRAEVGDQVFVVGAPLGISRTLTVGHLSARRTMNSTSGGMVSRELFQTDASINQGSSGGPLFDMNGNVIGIVSYIMSRSGGSDGLGFVVTSNTARRLLVDERTVWSGLDGYLLAGDLARAFNLPTERGALLVQRVAAGSPAERLGLRGGTLPVSIGQETILLGGDVILAVEGIGIGTPQSYDAIRRRLIELRAGSGSIRVTVLRGGVTTDLTGVIEG